MSEEATSNSSPLLAALYGLGAEIVVTVTDAKKAELSALFAGQTERLEMTLPPGHYVFCRVPLPPASEPGIDSVTNPVGKPEHGGHGGQPSRRAAKAEGPTLA